MADKTIEMTLAKTTKGTIVYSCGDDNTPIRTLYILRDELPKNPPEKIKVTIEWP